MVALTADLMAANLEYLKVDWKVVSKVVKMAGKTVVCLVGK